jgi:hypothetical protein
VTLHLKIKKVKICGVYLRAQQPRNLPLAETKGVSWGQLIGPEQFLLNAGPTDNAAYWVNI